MSAGTFIKGLVFFAGLGCTVFVLLFLGGLASAAWEIRGERKRGQEPTRPAWENAAKRRALGGLLAQIRAAWAQARHRGDPVCWCGRGPLVVLPLVDGPAHACAAWEAGDVEAVRRHDAAGGYRPVPLGAGDGAVQP